MDLRNSPIRGIVEVMDDQQSRAREESLTSALQRLSQAREQRGSVGVLDPFEVLPLDERYVIDEADEPEAPRRRLFGFSLRARRASDALDFDAE